MSVSNLKERQRQLREEVIIDTAYAMLGEVGYDAMSMDDLAARVGVSKATLYQHFNTKEEVAINVICRSLRIAIDDVRSQADQNEPAIQRLERCLITSYKRRLDFGQAGLVLPIMTVKKHPRYVAAMNDLIQLLEEVAEQARAEGAINPALNTCVIVRMALAMMRTDMEDMLTCTARNRDALLETLTTVFMNGIKPQKGP